MRPPPLPRCATLSLSGLYFAAILFPVKGYYGDDEESYKPSVGEISSIVLISLCCFCTLTSLLVACRVCNIGTHTASSKLIMYLTLSHANMNFAKMPFLFNSIPYGCVVSGILFFYSYTQIFLITFFMLVCTYTLLLEGNLDGDLANSRRLSFSDYELNGRSKIIIFLLPAITLVFPLLTGVFEEKFNWCGINPDSKYGFYVLIQYLVLFSVVSLFEFRQLYKIFFGLRLLAGGLSAELFERFLKGPFLYSFTCFAILLSSTIFIFTRVNGDDEGQREYYHQYGIIISMYLPGPIYFIIFCIEKTYLEAIENDYEEMNLFAREFENSADASSFHLSWSRSTSQSNDGALRAVLL